MQRVSKITQNILQSKFTDLCIGSCKIDQLASFSRSCYQLLQLNKILTAVTTIKIFSIRKCFAICNQYLVCYQNRIVPETRLFCQCFVCINIIMRSQKGKSTIPKSSLYFLRGKG